MWNAYTKYFRDALTCIKDCEFGILFTLQMLFCIEKDKRFLDRISSSNEETFDMCQTVNRHNYDPHKFTEHNHVSPKVNVERTLMKDKVTGLFFFAEHLVTGKSSLTMVKNTALSHTPTGRSIQTGFCTTALLPLPFWTSGMAVGSYSLVPPMNFIF
jgi:hypothetical protein